MGLFPVVLRPRWASWVRSSSTLSLFDIAETSERGREQFFETKISETCEDKEQGRTGLSSIRRRLYTDEGRARTWPSSVPYTIYFLFFW